MNNGMCNKMQINSELLCRWETFRCGQNIMYSLIMNNLVFTFSSQCLSQVIAFDLPSCFFKKSKIMSAADFIHAFTTNVSQRITDSSWRQNMYRISFSRVRDCLLMSDNILC